MASDQQSRSPRRLLLVEDDGLTAATISELLTSHGFLVETVPGAADATQITLRWAVQSRAVAFTSLDNGQGPGNDDSSNATNAPGLGTQFLADCTTQWSRTYRDDGTKVDARIPISPVHEVPPQDSNQ